MRVSSAAAVFLVTVGQAAADTGTWTLYSEAPILVAAGFEQPADLRPLNPSPPTGAVIRSVTWAWGYEDAIGSVRLRICVEGRCIESTAPMVHDDRSLSGLLLDGIPKVSVHLDSRRPSAGPLSGSAMTVSIDWILE